jgi:hypothetical protein
MGLQNLGFSGHPRLPVKPPKDGVTGSHADFPG